MGLEKEDIMALIAILQKGLTDDEEELQYEEGASSTKTKRKKAQKKTRPQPKKQINKFDSMSERNMHRQDSKIDKLLWGETQPTDRGRSSGLIQVRCRVCGKNEEVSSSLVDNPERHKCNKCVATSG